MKDLIHLLDRLDGGSRDAEIDKVSQDKILKVLTSGKGEARHVKVLKLLNDEMKGKGDKNDRNTDRCNSSTIRNCNSSSVFCRRIV